MGEQMLRIASPTCRASSASRTMAALALLGACAFADRAAAQTCTVSGSSVTLTSGSCTIAPNTTLNGSPGVHATTSAQITTNNVTINPFNGGSVGGLAETLGTIVFSGGSSINGNWSTAASAQTGGVIVFETGSAINPPSGGGVTALLANGVGSGGQSSQIIATGLTVNMNGAGGEVAAKATGGGIITLNPETSISFPAGGGGDIGLLATGAGSQIVANGLTDNLLGVGGGDVGVNADSGGKVTLTNSMVSVVGAGSGEAGLKATNSGSIDTSGGSVAVTNGVGGLLQNGGTLNMTGTDVTASGNGGVGFLFNSGGSANTLNYSNGTITASAASFSVQGAAANINLAGTIAIVNNNTLLATSSSGSTTFNAQGSILQGVITTDASSTSTVNLTQGTVWTMTGNSNATNVTNDGSSIIFTPPSGDPTQLGSYKTLTAVNYTGTGGEILLNTYLGGDGSPSDRLIINGGTATSDATSLMFHNTTGPGGQTTANGILVVNAINGGTTAPGAFVLNGEARAGEFDYDLFRGGLGGTNPNDWFLRSTFIVPPEPMPPEPEPLPPDPPPNPLPPGVYPIIGPELATYGVVQPIARQLGLDTLGTLHERIGDTLTSENASGSSPGWGRADWGRFFGQEVNNNYLAFADPHATGWLGGFQGGIDLWRGSFLPGNRDAAGVYFAYGHADIQVSGLVTNPAATAYVLTHTGTVNLDAYSAAAYWTHYGPSGWYVDAVLQGTRYGGNATTQFAQLPTNGFGFISSLEAGYPVPLPLGPRFVLEPQAQIIWQQVTLNQANDGLGPVGLGTTSGPTGRVGVRAQWTIISENGQVWQPYVRANLWRDWGAEATTTFGIDSVPLVEAAMRLELAGGLTAKLNDRLSLYAQAGYQFAVAETNDTTRNGVKGDVGLRYAW
jgi:outer membrane autotransporter protein